MPIRIGGDGVKIKSARKVHILLVAFIGFALCSSLVSPALAISDGETVEFNVSVDPDLGNHATAWATLTCYGTSAQLIKVEVGWGKASLGGAIMMFQIGKEYTIYETDFPSVENHISVAWHPWWTFGFPIYGEGSRIMEMELSPIYYASYYFWAARVDYSSSEVWAELSVSVKTLYAWDSDIDFQALSLPPHSGGGGGGGDNHPV